MTSAIKEALAPNQGGAREGGSLEGFSPGFEGEVEALAARLELLRAEGYARQSIAEFRALEVLVRRIPRVMETARATLLKRARVQLEVFAERASAERTALHARFEGFDGEGSAQYRDAIEAGDLESARRALRRVRRGGRRLLGRPKARPRVDAAEEFQGETQRPLNEPLPRPRAAMKKAKEDRYREAALDAAAELTLLRAKRQLPEPELRGRYHAPTIAAESLAIMERVGRPYLLEQIARLEAYEAIAALIAEYPPKKRPRAKAKKSRKSRR